jgi:hypothetical protein
MRRFIATSIVAALAVSGAMWTATGAIAAEDTLQPRVTVCKLVADAFPAFAPPDRPGNTYAIMATGISCPAAIRVVKRAIKKTNPGPRKAFTGPGAFTLCTSITPATATKVFAGSCVKPGSSAVVVTWIPNCGDGPCKGLARPAG